VLTYSFIQHPIERIIGNLENTFPGISEAMIVYSSFNKDLIWKSLSEGEIETLSVKNVSHLIQKFRKDKSPYTWTQENSITFLNEKKRKSKKIKQLSFTDEDDNNLLCIKFLSPMDNLYDILLLKIENTSVFGMSKQGSTLNVQEKNIVGKLLYQTIKTRIEEEYNNNDTHRMVLNNIKLQQVNISKLEEENMILRSNYKKSVLYFINNVLSRMSDKFKMTVALSEKAQEMILDKDLDITTLEKVLIQAAHMAANLTLHYSNTIVIHPENIVVNQIIEEQPNLGNNDKHASIIEILDKYEGAAEKAIAQNWKINGNTVAQLCEPPITPSAITFNLKKYKKQVNILLGRYDEKWPILKTHFKPLKNIIEIEQSELSKFKSA
jgi:hypothetical protein